MRFATPALTLLCALLLCTTAYPQSAAYISQRHINEIAAVLEQTRNTVVEDGGLRHDGETLPGYLRRAAAKFPGEKPAQREARIEGYLKALAQATEATASIRRLPALQDDNETGRALWVRITRTVGFLPRRMVKLRAAWRDAIAKPTAATTDALGNELSQTMALVMVALRDLRYASP